MRLQFAHSSVSSKFQTQSRLLNISEVEGLLLTGFMSDTFLQSIVQKAETVGGKFDILNCLLTAGSVTLGGFATWFCDVRWFCHLVL